MRRHLAALLLAALALLGLQRVPCLLGAAGGMGAAPGAAIGALATAEVPPCHRPAEAPAERPSPCSDCDDLHRDVAGALAASVLDAPPAFVPAFAPATASAQAASLSLDARRAPARAPDPLRITGVLLL